MTVRELRRRWKPTKERLKDSAQHQPLLIRMHRACSWLQAVEDLQPTQLDERLIFQWIALNSLYGQWDPEDREPRPESHTLLHFVTLIVELDEQERVYDCLADQQRLVMAVMKDSYLTRFFWEEPTEERLRQGKSTWHKAKTWYIEGRYGLILDHVLRRIYLLRCQLVHGAATHGGSLNRTAIEYCSTVLGALIESFLLVMIDHGADEDWGELCYPPDPTAP